MKVLKEWCIDAPWGKIAFMSWGNPNGEPVLLVHGRQDSLVTFEPLLKLLPDSYHYVAFDLPGHGKSDGFPKGSQIQRVTYVLAVKVAVDHLDWQQFIYIGHSMASELGLFYSVLHPNRIKKMVLLDPGPSFQFLVAYEPRRNFKDLCASYYDNYKFFTKDDQVYTKESAIKAVMRNRSMTRDQAELLLSRNLIKVGEDKYKLSWERRLKVLYPLQNTLEYQKELFSKNSPPLFMVACTQSHSKFSYRDTWVESLKLLEYMSQQKNCTMITVEGDHDLHFKNPELFIKDLRSFLHKSFVDSKI
ncbi:serine hydrolase-like protein [Aricia agestis]|uniref:serine hydrolase-like protein n=1 Tax=Aricia agestis TaxID=91739 RepID=UPI001C205A14|nr:serine hydrolase-like protein [Aricia agestis]